MERTLVIFKPDALNRALVGEILHRFERKGLKIIGIKMMHLDDKLIDDHYGHHSTKPFFSGLKRYMQSTPSIVCVLEGYNAVSVVRNLTGVTKGYDALAGTIRGDFSISKQFNVIHASDSETSSKVEVKRFFAESELFDYEKVDLEFIYDNDEL
jgi:nucleoside-diphosphate kinase